MTRLAASSGTPMPINTISPIVPRGPESVDLVIDWLLPAGAGEPDAATIELITTLPMLVIKQDGAACELNQQGLMNKGFAHGMLVPQEYELWEFHEWLRERLGTHPASAPPLGEDG